MSIYDKDTAAEVAVTLKVLRHLFERFADSELHFILDTIGIVPATSREAMLDQLLIQLQK